MFLRSQAAASGRLASAFVDALHLATLSDPSLDDAAYFDVVFAWCCV